MKCARACVVCGGSRNGRKLEGGGSVCATVSALYTRGEQERGGEAEREREREWSVSERFDMI